MYYYISIQVMSEGLVKILIFGKMTTAQKVCKKFKTSELLPNQEKFYSFFITCKIYPRSPCENFRPNIQPFRRNFSQRLCKQSYQKSVFSVLKPIILGQQSLTTIFAGSASTFWGIFANVCTFVICICKIFLFEIYKCIYIIYKITF